MDRIAPPRRLPLVIRLWFAVDVLLALAPPLHWAASGTTPILGVPRVIFYLLVTSVVVSTSVVAAYLADGER